MSTLPDSELDLDKLFLPAWAQEPSASKYAHYEGETERPERRGDRDRRGPRPPRREGPPGARPATTTARAASVAGPPGLKAARLGPRAAAAGRSARTGATFAVASVASRRGRCRKLTSACAQKTKASNPSRGRSR